MFFSLGIMWNKKRSLNFYRLKIKPQTSALVKGRKGEVTGPLLQSSPSTIWYKLFDSLLKKQNPVYSLWLIYPQNTKKAQLNTSCSSQSWNASVHKSLCSQGILENFMNLKEKKLPQSWFWEIPWFWSLAKATQMIP